MNFHSKNLVLPYHSSEFQIKCYNNILWTGSIMEAAQNRPSFQTYLPNVAQEPPPSPLHRHNSFSSAHGSLERRVSEPYSPDVVRRKKDLNTTKRHSLLVESNLTKEAKEINRRSHDVTIVKNLSMGWWFWERFGWIEYQFWILSSVILVLRTSWLTHYSLDLGTMQKWYRMAQVH